MKIKLLNELDTRLYIRIHMRSWQNMILDRVLNIIIVSNGFNFIMIFAAVKDRRTKKKTSVRF